LAILVFRNRILPFLSRIANRNPPIDKTAIVRLYAAGDDIPDYKAGFKDNDPFTGKNIAVHHTAYRNKGAADIALHTGFLAYDYTACCVEVSADAAVYPRKTARLYVARHAGIGTDYGIDR
jgi:hypothetical protein